MAIDTDNKKLAIMEWDNIWEPALPLSPSTFEQDDKQQLIWGYSGVLWIGIPDVSVEESIVYDVSVIESTVYNVTVEESAIADVSASDSLG